MKKDVIDYRVELGSRIKFYREKRNLSQEQLAKMLSYSNKTSISNIEQGKANIPSDKLFQFATALNCTLDDLLGTEQDELESLKANAAEIVSEMESMQNILRILSKMDAKKLQQIEAIVKTFEE